MINSSNFSSGIFYMEIRISVGLIQDKNLVGQCNNKCLISDCILSLVLNIFTYFFYETY